MSSAAPRKSPPSRFVALRKRVGKAAIVSFFEGGSRLAAMHPRSRPRAHGVEKLVDIPYRATGNPDHWLDVYRPIDRPTSGKGLPVVLYMHGGAFQILSKNSHFMMGLSFAKKGYVVFVPNYRLAPKNRYPAAVEDCADAYAWVIENAAKYGGDPSRIILAGESAGANLVTTMTVAASYERPEPIAKKIHDTGVVPIATIPFCGILQVTDVARFGRRRSIPAWLLDRMEEAEFGYLPRDRDGLSLDLADPLVVLERGDAPKRPLPPFFIPCGTKDPLLDDSRRLGKALDGLSVKNQVAIYPGEIHAFHALTWRPMARKCWRDTFEFLNDVAPAD